MRINTKHNFEIDLKNEYFSLFNFGGTVVDLDVIIQKDFAELGDNWAGHGDYSYIYSGVLNMALDGVGREVSTDLLKYVYFLASGTVYLI